MNSEKEEPPGNKRNTATSSVPDSSLTNALKGIAEKKLAKINIEKVFVLNDPSFVKGLNPISGNVIQIQNSKGFIINKTNLPAEKKNNEPSTTTLTEYKNNGIESSVQVGVQNSRKIIINTAAGMTDLEVIQKLLAGLTSEKIENSGVKIITDGKDCVIQNDQVKNTSHNDEKDAPSNQTRSKIQIKNAFHLNQGENDDTKSSNIRNGPIKNDPVKNNDISSVKKNNCDKSKDVSKTLSTPIEKESPPKVQTDSPPEHPKRVIRKQKKYLYKLKAKNGKVLNYISDVPIVLKRPVIRLDKMTEADAKLLSKQFAKESKKKSKNLIELPNTTNCRTRASLLAKKKETPINNASSPSVSGIQTRKRQLKFLPDGRIMKDKKSRRPSVSSTSLSSSSDEERRHDTSDDDYSESSIKIIDHKKTSKTKKTTIEKKVDANTTNLVDNNVSHAQNEKPQKADSTQVKTSKITPSPPSIQSNKSSTEPVPQKRILIDPAKLLSTFIGTPITSSQLTVVRFKPKNLKPRTANATYATKQIFIANSAKPNELQNTNQTTVSKNILLPTSAVYKIANSTEPPPLSPISTPAMRHAIKNSPINSAPLHPIKRDSVQFIKKDLAPPNKTDVLSAKDQLQDIFEKFADFTDTKIVKTKQGPKKLIFDKLNDSDDPRTIYDVMSEVFDLMPSWNIHIIPDTKSFCLAQISRSRTGIPVLKKSIEINSEFVAKVYVHQLHCKRYDGIYDTESKIKKLIRDVDALSA